jgi:protease IV
VRRLAGPYNLLAVAHRSGKGSSLDEENWPSRQPHEGRRGRRRLPWILGGLAALGLLVLTIGTVAVVLAFAQGGGSAAPVLYEEEYVSGQGTDKIAVVPVEGTITPADSSVGGTQTTATPDGLSAALQQAADDANVAAVVLEIDSPGGGVTATEEMYQSILDFKKSTGMPVVVSMGSVAASGGYYISTAADEIVAYETTLTGSLGVIIKLTDFSEAAEKYGIQQEVIQSGEFKNMGSSFKELTPKEREIFQSFIDVSYEEFVSVIVEGRDMSEERVREIADGRIYSGEQAKELGLVDEFGGLDEAARIARERANVAEATVVRYVEEPSFFELMTARLAPQEPEAVQVMRAAGLEPTPTLQYLYRPGL